jgi:hypothetical protein
MVFPYLQPLLKIVCWQQQYLVVEESGVRLSENLNTLIQRCENRAVESVRGAGKRSTKAVRERAHSGTALLGQSPKIRECWW